MLIIIFCFVEKLPYRCFESTYILVLLRDGYGFNPKFRNITFTVDVNWTLGALLTLKASGLDDDDAIQSM
jgi:hypothetical protein